ELGDGIRRDRRVDLHHVRHADEACYRIDVAQEIEVKVLVKSGVDGVGRIDQYQRVSIGRGFGNGIRGEIVTSTRTVLDDELLTETPAKPVSEQPRTDIGGAARRISNEDVWLAGRIIDSLSAANRHKRDARHRNHHAPNARKKPLHTCHPPRRLSLPARSRAGGIVHTGPTLRGAHGLVQGRARRRTRHLTPENGPSAKAERSLNDGRIGWWRKPERIGAVQVRGSAASGVFRSEALWPPVYRPAVAGSCAMSRGPTCCSSGWHSRSSQLSMHLIGIRAAGPHCGRRRRLSRNTAIPSTTPAPSSSCQWAASNAGSG